MLAFACVSWAGVASSRWHAQRNGIARRSTSGARSSGLRSKRGEEQRTTVVWVDESAFYLLPLAVRTWAPRGQMPILRTRFSRDHLSVISGITLTEQLYLEVQDHAYTAESVVIFLHHLLDQITGHVTVIWDGAPIHRSRVINQFLAEGAAKRLHLERLPGYAPDLNPDEGVWNYLKRVELANVCCHDLADLTAQVQQDTQQVRAKPELLRACSRQCGYLV